MTADQCKACPFPDSVAALELVRLREGIALVLDDLRRYADPHDLSDPDNPRHVSVGLVGIRLRALLDDNEGER